MQADDMTPSRDGANVIGYERFLAAKVASDTEAIQSHYDLPVEFFAAFLGPRMAYSCAYFTDPDNSLANAEEDKLRLTAQKLELQPGDRVLDLGCGWGSFLFFAAEEYGCSTTGVTLSREQVAHVNRTAAERGLSDRVKAQLVHVYDMDFPKETFDKAVTIGAIEHIEDLERTFRKTNEVLRGEGLFLCHGMTKPWSQRLRQMSNDYDEVGEIVKRHFGVGHWKSFWEVSQALEQSGFEILDQENITQHYALTCTRWLENLRRREAEIAGTIVPDDKYREFVALMAGYVTGFQMSGTICNQILCQRHVDGIPRPERPLTRRHMLVSEPAYVGVPEPEEAVSAAEKVRRLLRGSGRGMREERRSAQPDESCRSTNPVLRDLFETRLAAAVKDHPQLREQIRGVIALELTGEEGCAYFIDSDKGSVLPGRCENAECGVRMEGAEFARLVQEGRVSDWLEAFKHRRIEFSGNLITIMRLQSIIASVAGSEETRRRLSA
ncbi:MAG: methyltransferase domain-containing protein [Actinobacteria bacterium]|nr:MAG: methyltransferase domain-containing protein [Actinomycetota bacterium]